MKYFSIPPEKLSYYPNIPSHVEAMIGENEITFPEEVLPAQSRERKKARKEKNTNEDINPVGARKTGRPKQAVQQPKGCQSILNFFSK